MIGLFIFGIVGLYEVSHFQSLFSTRLYADMSVSVSFLGCIISDELVFYFVLALSPSSCITCTGSLPSGSNVGVLYSYITGTISSPFKSRNIFMVSDGSIVSILPT